MVLSLNVSAIHIDSRDAHWLLAPKTYVSDESAEFSGLEEIYQLLRASQNRNIIAIIGNQLPEKIQGLFWQVYYEFIGNLSGHLSDTEKYEKKLRFLADFLYIQLTLAPVSAMNNPDFWMFDSQLVRGWVANSA